MQWLCNLGLAEGERARWSELMTPKAEKGLILKSIKVDFKFVSTYLSFLHIPELNRSSLTSYFKNAAHDMARSHHCLPQAPLRSIITNHRSVLFYP